MSDWLVFVPAAVALGVIVVTRQAVWGLLAAVVVAGGLLSGGAPVPWLRETFETHFMGKLLGSAWSLGAVVLTLVLGAFATVLERGGGFRALLDRIKSSAEGRSGRSAERRVLGGVYGLGLLCFFDGLANAILVGRVARPLVDGVRTSREMLAYVIDSTSAAVACVAFISTWIGTQLSLIATGLDDAGVSASPVELFFASIPTNAYCLLTLLLVPLVIVRGWKPLAMQRATPHAAESVDEGSISAPAWTALLPLGVLVTALPAFIYLWQDGSEWSWGNAFRSSGVPYAMFAAAVLALLAAVACYPRGRRDEVARAMCDGAGSLLPAVVILLLAWALGSQMKALGTAEIMAGALDGRVAPAWLPLAIFALGAAMSFVTGSSWGTMGLLMPLAVPLTVQLAGVEASLALLPAVIGAVFGGAVFGDHCSPFSDTTIVSALAAGCTPMAHVITQLPYALTAAGFAIVSYALLALGLSPWVALPLVAVVLVALILGLTRDP